MNKDSKLDESVTCVFKKIQEIEDSLKDLRLCVNHMEERAKKNRDTREVLENEIL
jgi:hypothetical protein